MFAEIAHRCLNLKQKWSRKPQSELNLRHFFAKFILSTARGHILFPIPSRPPHRPLNRLCSRSFSTTGFELTSPLQPKSTRHLHFSPFSPPPFPVASNRGIITGHRHAGDGGKRHPGGAASHRLCPCAIASDSHREQIHDALRTPSPTGNDSSSPKQSSRGGGRASG